MHVKIIARKSKPDAKSLLLDDVVVLVDDDGRETDISPIVRAWGSRNVVGSLRMLDLTILHYTIEEQALKEPISTRRPPAARAHGEDRQREPDLRPVEAV